MVNITKTLINNKLHKLLYLLFLAFAVRIIFSFLPAFEYDQRDFRFWSLRLAETGPSNFYSKDVFTNNPTGFLYILWGIGLTKDIFKNLSFFQTNQHYDLLLKLPSNLADLVTAVLIYLIIRRKLNERWSLIAFSLYAFNPAIIFDSAVWGQYDGIGTLSLVLSIYFLFFKNSPEISTIFATIAWTFKPQMIAFAPIFLTLIILRGTLKMWFSSLLTLLIAAILIYLPFYPSNPIYGLIYTNTASMGLFKCTTCFALNFWGIFGNWQNDLESFLKIPLLYYGIILQLISYIPIFLFKSFKKRFQQPYIYLTTAVSLMSFFMLLTRMHERYLFPFFAFFLTGAILLRSKKLILLYIVSSSIFLINLYIPYSYYNRQLMFSKESLNLLYNNFPTLSFWSFAIFIIIIVLYIKKSDEKNL